MSEATVAKKKKRNNKKPAELKAGPPKTGEQRAAEKQALAMWALLGAGGEAYGSELKPGIEKPERAALEQVGLIKSEKRERGAIWSTVTDRGWDWAEQHLAASLPDKTFAGAFVLQAWLTRLQIFLRARDIRLIEMFAEQPTKSPVNHTAGRSLDYSELRARIRAAYHEVAGDFDRRVLLRDLRPKLQDLGRRQIDAALMQMLRDEEASLMQLDYRPDVTDEDHAAALQIGNEPRHIIWISK
jgi:hypothetical protein